MTGHRRYIHPENWPPASGYSHGISASGRTIFVSGQIGWNPRTTRFESDDFGLQAEQALRNVVDVLAAGGAAPSHIMRMTWYVTDRAAYMAARPALAGIYRSLIGRHFPSMSVVVVKGLLEERALLEIEATAVVPEPGE